MSINKIKIVTLIYCFEVYTTIMNYDKEQNVFIWLKILDS